MPTLADMLVAHIDGQQRSLESGGARPLEGTDRTIRHKRRVRQGTTASIAVIAGGALATSGAVALKRAMDQEPAAYYLPEGGGEVTIPVDGPDPTAPHLDIKCGDPAPEPVAVADGFALEFQYEILQDPPSSYEYIDGRATITNTNEEQFPAYLLGSSLVTTQDGVVVSVQPNAGQLPSQLPFTPGRTSQIAYTFASPLGDCGDTDFGWVPQGEVEVYVVTHIGNSPQIAALMDARTPSGQGVYFSEDPWLQPLDWECANSIVWGSDSPPGSYYESNYAACLPRQNQDAVWNAEERTVTVPYRGAFVTRVFSTAVISEPITLTVKPQTEADTFGGYVDRREGAPTLGEMQCGASWPQYTDQSSVQFYSTHLSARDLGTGATVDGIAWLPFGPGSYEGRTARVTTAPQSHVYFLDERIVSTEYGSLAELFVAGTGYVTVADGNAVALSRATGPTAVEYEFSSIKWCGGEPPTGDLFAHVVGEVTLTGEGGEQSAPQFGIWWGSTTDAD